MPAYKEVAQLTLKSLIDESDRPEVVRDDESLQALAAKLSGTAGHTVVVVDAEQRVTGVVTATDIASAIGQGLTLEVPASKLIERKPPVVTVPDTSLLEQVPSLVGPYSTVIVTDDNGQPEAVLDREVVAQRIRNRFVPAP